MQFSQPYALGLLVLVLVPLFTTLIIDRRYQIYLSEYFKEKSSKKFTWIRTFLASTIIIGLVLTLANPIRTQSIQNPLKNGIDILFVLDLSKSMLAEDITPNRINAGKRVLSNFISNRQDDRIGLIGFSGKPFVFSPLTFDHIGLLSIVSDMTVDSIKQEIPGFSGTAIGDALLLASDSMITEPERKKVIILLTDGEANVGIDPKIANEYMKRTGYVVHTIGIGDPEGTELYVTDSFGKRQYFMDYKGIPIRASIDEKLLKQIAADNHGIYANAASLNQMEKALEDLNRLYGKTLKVPEEIQVISYAANIAFALIWIVLLWIIFEMFTITSAFHLRKLSKITLTAESTNYTTVTRMIWSKRVFLIFGSIILCAWAFTYHYSPPLGTISILIDGSKSMLVRDVWTSRFELAKWIAKKIIEQYSGNPIGISLFGGDLLTVLPSTYDTGILKQNLDSLSLSNIAGGSDIMGSVRSFISSIWENPHTIFVISDGEIVGNRSSITSAYLNLPKNISLWTIGVGTEKWGYIPLGTDMFGNTMVKMINGSPVISKISEELLQKLAQNWGEYIHATDLDSIKIQAGNGGASIGLTSLSDQMIFTGSLLLLLAITLPYRKRITR